MSERLTRLDPDASPEEREAFAAEFYAALNRLGVRPGDTFFLSTPSGAARARRTDPVTSHEAAEAATAKLRESQSDVLRIFREWKQPMTDEQLQVRYANAVAAGLVGSQEESGIRSRRDELVKAGLLIDTGDTLRNSNGNRAILWGLPPVMEEPPAEEEPSALFEMAATDPTRRTYAQEEA